MASECSCGRPSCSAELSPRTRCISLVQPVNQRDDKLDDIEETLRHQSGSAQEVPLTHEDEGAINREIIIQCVQDLLYRSKHSSAITIKAVKICEIETLLRAILARRKQTLQDKVLEQSKIRTCMLGIQELLMAGFSDSSLQILNKNSWCRRDVLEAKSLISQALRFRELGVLLGEVLLAEIDDEKRQKEEVSQFEDLIVAQQEVAQQRELRLRITPVNLPARVRVRNLDLRPGERQIRVTQDHVFIETVTDSEPPELCLLKRSRKVAQNCPGGPGFPADHRVLTLKDEDLESEPAGALSEPLVRD